MPLALQPTHIIIILVVGLVIFGPSRLGGVGRSFGKMLREYTSAIKETPQSFKEGISSEIESKGEAIARESQVTCKNCGKAVQAAMRFCPECGTAIIAKVSS